MYAIFTEVNVPPDAPVTAAADGLRANAVPGVRAAGAADAYWLAPHNGRAVGVVLFGNETAARATAEGLRVGGRPRSAPPGVTFCSVEVLEVIAHL